MSLDALEKTNASPATATPRPASASTTSPTGPSHSSLSTTASAVTKDAIFHYVYAALHDPVWRETYAINLRREFPRIPLHDDFARWAAWGEALMALHVGYEGVDPLPLVRTDTGTPPGKPVLASDRATGTIRVDGATALSGLPPAVWEYRLGNRTGIDWVLDQHREKKVRDATVEAWLKDNPDARYRFAAHKERVIDLIGRVARVSVETVAIVGAMREVRARADAAPFPAATAALDTPD